MDWKTKLKYAFMAIVLFLAIFIAAPIGVYLLNDSVGVFYNTHILKDPLKNHIGTYSVLMHVVKDSSEDYQLVYPIDINLSDYIYHETTTEYGVLIPGTVIYFPKTKTFQVVLANTDNGEIFLSIPQNVLEK